MKFALAALVLSLSACAPFIPSSRWVGQPMFVVSNVQPAQLAGKWYEVASFPTPFQAGCFATTAEYTPRPDGTIGVRNQCRDVAQPNVLRQIEGTATIVGPGQLQVRLNGVPFPAKYWVLDVADGGRTLVVGTPTRMGGWVLRRSPDITPEELFRARAVFERNGYDIAALQRTRQR
jgi:apolipoprotein D and lipocalin family protein